LSGASQTTVRIKREGEKSSVLVEHFSAKHREHFEALSSSGSYADMQTEAATWRFERGAWPSFKALLIREGETVSVHGGLAWSDEDIRQFLSRLQLRDNTAFDGG
jgi:hypothetical protein